MQCSAREQYGIALAEAYSRSPLALRPALLEALASVIAAQREQASCCAGWLGGAAAAQHEGAVLCTMLRMPCAAC